MSSAKIKAELEARLEVYAGKPVIVAVRTLDEMAAVLKANPFPEAAEPNGRDLSRSAAASECP